MQQEIMQMVTVHRTTDLRQNGNWEHLQKKSSEQYVYRIVQRTHNDLVLDEQS